MLAMRADQRPEPAVAHQMLTALFGPAGVKQGGAVFTEFEARGPVRGAPVRVVLTMSRTRTGTQPFTTIEVEDELDVSVYSGGAGWPYPPWEPFSRFQGQRLVGTAMAGVPRALLTAITQGPIGERLSANGISRLTLGSDAKRVGCATQGVQWVIEGWPLDEATLRFVVDTAVELALAARHELARGCQPEVAAYRAAREVSRRKGLRVVAAVFGGLLLLTALAAAAIGFR